MTQTTRPELGELKVGQTVIVRRSGDLRHVVEEGRYVKAEVVKANRVWIEIDQIDAPYPRTWRMRRDTQNEGTGTSYVARFATVEQHAWDQRQEAAFSVLRGNGIRIENGSPWRGREAELADLLTRSVDTSQS